MNTNHIDQLAEWWENAEVEGIVREGDTIIKKGRAGYDVYTAGRHEDGEDVCMWKYEQDPPTADYRILARAPKPKPAWHDAVAVIAATDRCERQVWERDTTYENRWYGTARDGAVARDLRDVTPLIEAKVTDEMVKRARAASTKWEVGGLSGNAIDAILTAALGLETA